jgi:hypothetical protein
MGQAARVKSIDALQAMSATLSNFHDDARSALDDLEMELRRALQWINQDCPGYWKQEMRLARDALTEATLQLENAKMFRRITDEHKSFIEEKKAVDRAKRRLHIAEEKVAAIPHWATMIERAVNEFRGSRSQFANWLDADYPRAVAMLSRMINDLEAYVRLEAPAGDQSPIAVVGEAAGEKAMQEGEEQKDVGNNENTH